MKMINRFKLLVILSIISYSLIGQSRWTNIYYGQKDAFADSFIEAYDHGYIIAGRHESSYSRYGWLIKTGINGNILWNKTIAADGKLITVLNIGENNSGELFLVGGSDYYEEFRDAFVIKLDTCGEKLWCCDFYEPGYLNYAFKVQATENGGCAVLLYSSVPDEDLCLAKLDVNGELLWKHCYGNQDTSLWEPFGQSLILTQDNGFLISGYCYYEDPNPPHAGWVKPYYIKTDSLGLLEWELVVHKEVGQELGGDAWTTTINPTGSYYYSSISHYYPDYKNPALLKMDMNGNLIDIYDIVNGYKHGGLGYATFINDTILAAGSGWGNSEDDLIHHAILIDTLGDIINLTDLVHDIYGSILQVTYDTKLVYMYNTFQNGQFDVYLRKLNQELEDDTLYTYPFHYDTLCPYPIASDTITIDDCGLIVGSMEQPIPKEESNVLEIYPNPAKNQINCRLPAGQAGFPVPYSILSIWIYDMLGGIEDVVEVSKGLSEIQIDVSNFSPGIYIAILKAEKEIIARTKFIKK